MCLRSTLQHRSEPSLDCQKILKALEMSGRIRKRYGSVGASRAQRFTRCQRRICQRPRELCRKDDFWFHLPQTQPGNPLVSALPSGDRPRHRPPAPCRDGGHSESKLPQHGVRLQTISLIASRTALGRRERKSAADRKKRLAEDFQRDLSWHEAQSAWTNQHRRKSICYMRTTQAFTSGSSTSLLAKTRWNLQAKRRIVSVGTRRSSSLRIHAVD